MAEDNQKLRDELDGLAAAGVLDDSIGCALEQIEEVAAYALHHRGGFEPSDYEARVGYHPLLLAPSGPLPGGEWDERTALEYIQRRVAWIKAACAVASLPKATPSSDTATPSPRRRLWRRASRRTRGGLASQIPLGTTAAGNWVWSAPWAASESLEHIRPGADALGPQ